MTITTSRTVGRVVGGALLSLSLFSSNVFAQGNSDVGVPAIEEILVSAQKREQNLQDVPIAISAFTEEMIENSRIEGFNDIAARVPGFSFSNLSKVRTFPALRGASSSLDAPGGDQAVAIFVDEVFYGGVGDFDPFLFDLERIEVLRGPQGTLFGRNVVGGAISIITRKPGDEPYAKAEFGIGSFDLLTAAAAIGGPLTDTVSGQISFSSRKMSGTSYNRVTETDVDGDDKSSVRARLRFQPTDNFEALIGGEFFRDTSDGQARAFNGPPPSIPETAGFIPDDDPYTIDSYVDGSLDREASGLNARLTWDFDAGRLISISAYRKNDSVLLDLDGLGAPTPTFSGSYFSELSQFSQEIRFESTPNDGPIDWVAGIYYLDLENQRLEDLLIGLYAGTEFGQIQIDNFGTTGIFRNQAFQDVTTKSVAAYADVTYRPTDSLTISAGGRFTRDEKTGTGFFTVDRDNFIWGDTDFTAEFGDEWDAFTPRLSVSYQVNDDAMVYATVSRGWKSGAFVISDTALGSEVPIEPEEAINYEIGLKSQWFEDRLRFNVTAYSVDYTDLQVETTLATGETIIENAGKSSVDGIEVEIDSVPTDNWRLWGNYSYLDAKYDFFPPDLTGANLALAPPRTLSVGSSYTWEIGSNGGFATLSADYQYKATHELEPRPTGSGEEAFLSGYDSLVNANLTIGMAGGEWELVFWGKNLTNENYVVYGQDLRGFLYSEAELATNPAAAAANFPRYNRPRTYGVSVRWNMQ